MLENQRKPLFALKYSHLMIGQLCVQDKVKIYVCGVPIQLNESDFQFHHIFNNENARVALGIKNRHFFQF